VRVLSARNRKYRAAVAAGLCALVASCAPSGAANVAPDAGSFKAAEVCNLSDSVRVVTANLAHFSFPDPINDPAKENLDAWAAGWDDAGVDTTGMLFGQIAFLDGLQDPAMGSVFAIQEHGNNYHKTWAWNLPLLTQLFLSSVPGCASNSSHFTPWFFTGVGEEVGSTLVTSGLASESAADWNLFNGCSPPPGNSRKANLLYFPATDHWVINVHLQFCATSEGSPDFSQNWCQLNNLLDELDVLIATNPGPILLTGDFNIHSSDPGGACAGDNYHPKRYNYLLSQLSTRGFVQTGASSPDYVFVRDVDWTLASVETVYPATLHSFGSHGEHPVSDHGMIQTDLHFSGPGFSPNAVAPLMAAILY